MTKAYPIMLLLSGKNAVVVGGGSVAARKVKGLIECEARVSVISPEINETLQTYVSEGLCAWKKKRYESSDIAEADIVFAATDDEDVNREVSADSQEARLMVNVADEPELCSFFLPSVLRRGDLTIAVSTTGSSPWLSHCVRNDLENIIGPEYEPYVGMLHSVRKRVNSEIPPKRRLDFWKEATDGRVLSLIAAGEETAAQELLENLLDSYLEQNEDYNEG